MTFTLLLKSLSSFTSTFTSAKVYLWPVIEVCSVTVEFGCMPSICSLNLAPSVLAVSQTQHTPYYIFTSPDCCSFRVLSLGLTNRDLGVLKCLWYKGTLWDLNTL